MVSSVSETSWRREAEHLAQDQHRALARGQVLERRDERQLDALALLVARLGRRSRPQAAARRGTARSRPPRRAAARGRRADPRRGRSRSAAPRLGRLRDQVEARVGGDPVEPRADRAAAARSAAARARRAAARPAARPRRRGRSRACGSSARAAPRGAARPAGGRRPRRPSRALEQRELVRSPVDARCSCCAQANSQERPALAAVGRHLVDDAVALQRAAACRSARTARRPSRGAGRRGRRGAARRRRGPVSGVCTSPAPSSAVELQAGGQVGTRQPVAAGRAGGHVAAAEQRSRSPSPGRRTTGRQKSAAGRGRNAR